MEWVWILIAIIAVVTMPFWLPFAIIAVIALLMLAGMFWGLEGIVQYTISGGDFPIGRTIAFTLCGLPFFILIGYAISECSSKAKRSDSRRSKVVRYGHSYSSSGGYLPTTRTTKRKDYQGKASPVFRTHKIDNAVFSGDKILREKSGKKIGTLSKPLIGEGQIVKDASGKKVGKIEQSLWNRETQIIKDSSGKKVGTIETNVWGSRVVKDSDGKTVGEIKKNIWGETVVKRKDC